MRTRLQMIAAIAVVGVALAACSSPAASTASVAPPAAASEAPSTAASEAPSTAASVAPSAAADTAIEAKEVGTIGTVLVASSNGMTVYTFTKDTKDSGTSACTGGCIETWPALTVAAGTTPAGGAGVTGTLGTITREDDGTLQVTYNGLPLYFFKNDKAPGDSNGVYENWEAVKP
jgi:predicted lipoprotein with Yx(FWY)xxD motif